MLFTALPLDLIHNLFLALDDRTTLAALLSTNSHLHRVFKSHPSSILCQVVSNEIGMDVRVLPYAWASFQSQYITTTEELIEAGLEIAPKDSSILSLTPYTFRILREGHAIMQGFAKCYSIWYKEGRILCDSLTDAESRRFQIAAYLFRHYQTIWNRFQEYAFDFSDDEEEDTGIEPLEDPAQDAKTMDACRAFLWRLPTEELLWIQEFRDFLLQDMEYTLDLKNNPTYFTHTEAPARNTVDLSIDTWRHFLLSMSIRSLGTWGSVFTNNGYGPTHLHRKELWLTDALFRALKHRGVQKQAHEETILRSKGMLIPGCQKCGKQRDSRQLFFNKTNLEDLPDYCDCFVFLGQLQYNSVETGRVLRRIHSPAAATRDDIAQKERLVAIHEIMEHAEKHTASFPESGEATGDSGLVVSDDEDEPDQAEEMTTPVKVAYKWSPGDVLCLSCFTPIFSELYYAWWLDERQTDRVEAHTFAEGQCWWGYECRSQRRHDHARRRDHCCPRTKGAFP